MDHGNGSRDRFHDHVALDEIELYAEVLIAAAGTEHRLSLHQIDRALGLRRDAEEETQGGKALPVPRPPAPRTEKHHVRPVRPPSPAPTPTDHPPPTRWVLPWPAGGVRTFGPPHLPTPPRFAPWRR